MRKCSFLFLISYLCFFSVSSFAQTITEQVLHKFPADTLPLKLKGIYKGKFVTPEFSGKVKRINNRISVDREIELSLGGDGTKEPQYLLIDGFHFIKPVTIETSNIPLFLTITNCYFAQGIRIAAQTEGQVDIQRNIFNGSVKVSVDSEEALLTMFENSIRPDLGEFPKYKHGGSDTDEVYENSVLDTMRIFNDKVFDFMRDFDVTFKGEYFAFGKNKIVSAKRKHFTLTLDAAQVEIQENTADGPLFLKGNVSNEFSFERNHFKSQVSIEKLTFPPHSNLDWLEVISHLGVLQDTAVIVRDVPIEHGFFRFEVPEGKIFDATFNVEYLFDGSSTKALLRSNSYKALIFSHKRIFDILKERGDIEYANYCFVRVKDLEGRRLSAIYRAHGGFKNLFRLGLNRLMKLYTNHATDPAQALVVSVYIILLFALIYFFYPSDWDISSKGRLISNFRDFIQKNDKGYWRPLGVMLSGFMLSLVNALSLSVNAFVTLGFGNIPTHGLARYICIIQGFLGWFLLSIFTVALFNQVLF